MGASFSTNVLTASEVETTTNSIVLSTAQTCGASVNENEVFVISGNNNVVDNLNESQSGTFTFSCFGSAESQAALLNMLNAQLSTSANATAGIALGLAFATNVTYDSTVSSATNSVLSTTTQTCATSANINLEVEVTGNYNDLVNDTFTQNAQVLTTCIFGSSNLATVSNQIASSVNAVSTANAGISIDLAAIIIAVVAILAVVIIVVVIVVCLKTPIPQAAADAITQQSSQGFGKSSGKGGKGKGGKGAKNVQASQSDLASNPQLASALGTKALPPQAQVALAANEALNP
jgi:hypothetical protein